MPDENVELTIERRKESCGSETRRRKNGNREMSKRNEKGEAERR
jgi:hypothetical protein